MLKGGPFSLSLEFPEKSYLKLLDAIGDAEIVCIGDSSHGTQEFYVFAELNFRSIVLSYLSY
jgi:erythromycin esterase-like protein